MTLQFVLPGAVCFDKCDHSVHHLIETRASFFDESFDVLGLKKIELAETDGCIPFRKFQSELLEVVSA